MLSITVLGANGISPPASAYQTVFLQLFTITGTFSQLIDAFCVPVAATISSPLPSVVCTARLVSPASADAIYPQFVLLTPFFVTSVPVPCGTTVFLVAQAQSSSYACGTFGGTAATPQLCCSPPPPGGTVASPPPPISVASPPPSPPPKATSPPPPPVSTISPPPSPKSPPHPPAPPPSPSPPPPVVSGIPITYTVNVSTLGLSGVTVAQARAILCPKLRTAVIAVFTAGNATFTQAGNTQNGCSSVVISDGFLVYTSAFVTNQLGNSVTVASFQATQAGDTAFPVAAHLVCLSTVKIVNTNTGIQRAQLAPFNTEYLNPTKGCSETIA